MCDAGLRHRRRGDFSTSTVNPAAQLVPWLAADGPLAYTPDEPPAQDYSFQYSWILPGIFTEHTNNYVVFKTRGSNIRLTTFFAGEHEVRIIDPRLLELREAHGCHVEYS